MLTKQITFKVDEETLAGTIINSQNNNSKPNVIFLHGAGSSVKETLITSFAQPIVDNNYNILALDFSGHGQSSGELKKSSLKKRVIEAQAAIDKFATKEPISVCSSSMGGYIAIKLLKYHNIKNLILFCPALYAGKAYDVQFDNGFTEIIREHESWRNSDVLDLLESFTGKLLVIMGELDAVIPPGVIDLINKHTPNTSKKEIYTIKNCPHKIDNWIVDYPEELLKLQHKILEYLV